MKEPEPKKAEEARKRTKGAAKENGEEKRESNTQVKNIHLIMSLKKNLKLFHYNALAILLLIICVVLCIDQIETSTSSPRAFVFTLSLPKYLTKFLNFILLNDEKQIVPCESTAKEVSFEW